MGYVRDGVPVVRARVSLEPLDLGQVADGNGSVVGGHTAALSLAFAVSKRVCFTGQGGFESRKFVRHDAPITSLSMPR